MKLSKNFTLSEATKSQTALRRGINNQPDDSQIEKLKYTAENILQKVRDHYKKSFSPSSWFRSIYLCIAIGSSSTSQHAKAEAVDFEVPGVDNLELAKWIIENLDFDQVILEFYKENIPSSGWVHASTKEDGSNRHEILHTFNGKNYFYGLPKF